MIPKLKDLKYGDKNISRVLLEDKVIWSREPDHEYEVIFKTSLEMNYRDAERIVKNVKVSIGRDLRTCKRFEINQKQGFMTLDYVRVNIGAKEYPCKSSRVNGEMKFILEDFKQEYEDRGDYIIWNMEIDVFGYSEYMYDGEEEKEEFSDTIKFDIKIKK